MIAPNGFVGVRAAALHAVTVSLDETFYRLGLVKIVYEQDTDAYHYLTTRYPSFDAPHFRFTRPMVNTETGADAVEVWLTDEQLEKMLDELLTDRVTIE